MSLVANYTDSEEEQEEESQIIPTTNEKITLKSSNSSSLLRNPFGVHDKDEGEDSTSTSEEDEQLSKTEVKSKKIGDGTPLDNPFRFFGSGNVAAEDSVLRVEFREQEAKKTAVLEKHVKMSQGTTTAATTINGKKICWNNRRGRCRFGHNCKFAHDTDTAVIDPDSIQTKLPNKNFHPVLQNLTGQFKGNPFCMDNIDWDSSTPVVLSSLAQLSGGGGDGQSSGSGLRKGEQKSDNFYDLDEDKKSRKKRPGLTTGLNPSKKVMKMYYDGKEKEKT